MIVLRVQHSELQTLIAKYKSTEDFINHYN